jgi:hypothetical protein
VTATRRRANSAAAPGFVLLAVLLWLAVLATVALGAALVTMSEPATTAAAHDRARLRRAAESAATLAVLDLATRFDWRAIPAGSVASPFTDGGAGPRMVGGRAVDLAVETWRRTCGRDSPCDDATTVLSTEGRPWGRRNPRWRLYAHLPFSRLDAAAGDACECYLVAWVSDDPADGDGDADADAPHGVDGHGVLLVRGAAFGAGGGVAEVEALVAQPCRVSGAVCPGIRVQSWGAVGESVP